MGGDGGLKENEVSPKLPRGRKIIQFTFQMGKKTKIKRTGLKN